MTDTTNPEAEFSEMMNRMVDGWKSAMGVTFTYATADEVRAELRVGPMHLQPLGMVHGGVHAGLIESVASVGASLAAMAFGNVAVGLENHTSFVRSVREGTLRAVGRPISNGRRTSVWGVSVTDDLERVVATGTVRLLSVPQPSAPVSIEPPL